MKCKIKLYAALCIIAMSALSASAWGRLGHDAVAGIAEKHLTPRQRQISNAIWGIIQSFITHHGWTGSGRCHITTIQAAGTPQMSILWAFITRANDAMPLKDAERLSENLRRHKGDD